MKTVNILGSMYENSSHEISGGDLDSCFNHYLGLISNERTPGGLSRTSCPGRGWSHVNFSHTWYQEPKGSANRYYSD